MQGYVSKIETLGLADGPGIRTVIFLGGCKLRCKYCHNPEMWNINKPNITTDELVKKIVNNKPYFSKTGGVTLSGGEPLIQDKFLLDLVKKLKNEHIHIALDTAGVGNGNYEEILKYIDLVILDIKHTDPLKYKDLTGNDMNEFLKFKESLNKSNKNVWIRQVIIPDITDNMNYLKTLKEFIKDIKNIKKIEFLPYHKIGDSKYIELNILNPYKDKKAMDSSLCDKLYEEFIKISSN